jgi:hypothetical protein
MEYIKNAMIRCEEIFNIEAESKDVYELYHPRLEIEKLIDNTNLILEKYEKLNSLAKDDFDN